MRRATYTHRLPHLALILCCILVPVSEGRRDRDDSRDARQNRRERRLEVRVRSVSFVGNETFTRWALRDRMATKPSRPLRRAPYSRDVLDDDIRVLHTFYRNQGFLTPTVRIDTVRIDSSRQRKRALVVIGIEEGPRTYVSSVKFQGNTIVRGAELKRLIKTGRDDPFSAPQIDRDAGRIGQYYGKHGYLRAKVTPTATVNDSAHRASVVFAMEEYEPSTTAKVYIDGLDKVHRVIVLREQRFKRGDTLTTDRLRTTVQGLYRTGVFKRATVTPALRDSLTDSAITSVPKDVRIRVDETDMFSVGLGIGYGTYDQVRVSGDIAYRNLFRRGKKISLAGKASMVTQNAALTYTDPAFAGLNTRLDISGSVGHYDEPGYEANIGAANASLSSKADMGLGVRLRYRWEDLRYLDLPEDAMDDLEKRRVQSLTGVLSLDRRDDPLTPHRGFLASARGEIAGIGRTGTDQFYRLIADLRGYLPIRQSFVLSSAVRVGYVSAYGASTQVPPKERLYAGGNTSLRGFRTRMVGPLVLDTAADELEPTGGNILTEIHLAELRFRIYKVLHGTVFVDAGNVVSTLDDLLADRLRWSLGFGLNAELSIGVIRLDLGFPLGRNPYDPDEPFAWPHLDIGYAF